MLTLKAILNGILAVASLMVIGVFVFVKFSRNRIHRTGVSYTEARHYVEQREEGNAFGMPTILSC